MSEKQPAPAPTRRRQECHACAHLVTDTMREKVITHCGKGGWDVMNRTGAPQWYAINTVRLNRPPVNYLGRTCRVYQQKEGV